MDKLNFYTVDLQYVDFLKTIEHEKRGFSRVPNMNYGKQHKPKFPGLIANSCDFKLLEQAYQVYIQQSKVK